jgi:hypothetical protein
MTPSNKAFFVVSAIAALVLATSGCGDDAPSSTDAGTDAGVRDSGTDTGTAAGDAGARSCANATDGPKLSMTFDAGMSGGGAPPDIAVVCALQCFGMGGATEDMCNLDCIRNTTGLSTECSGCFAGLIKCAITNCAMECVPAAGGDPGSMACGACQCGMNDAHINCLEHFDGCSRLGIAAGSCG